jgi:glycosyl transferase family 87
MRAAAVKVLPPLFLLVLPVLAYANLFHVAWSNGSIAVDFHNEIYPEAKVLLRGESPFPDETADLSHGSNHIWPPLVGYAAAPLTALSPGAADIVIVLVGIACFGAALWIVGVRDWRVFGAASLWGPVIGEMRTAHLSLILCLLAAVVWRTREQKTVAGLTLGLAIALKFFLWPLAVWLASLRRWREAAIAAATAAASLLLLLPFIGILEYARLLRRLGATFDQDAFTPYGLLVQADVPSATARVVGLAIGIGVLALAWRRRSFALFVAAALLLSPIVWLDYFALTAIPLAVVRPTFSWVWLIPILTFGIPSAGAGAGVPIHILRVAAVFAVVVWYTARRERSGPVGTVARFTARPREVPADP